MLKPAQAPSSGTESQALELEDTGTRDITHTQLDMAMVTVVTTLTHLLDMAATELVTMPTLLELAITVTMPTQLDTEMLTKL